MSESHINLSNRAKGLVEQNPQEAYELYVKLFAEFAEECNGWDAFNLIKSQIREINSACIEVFSNPFPENSLKCDIWIGTLFISRIVVMFLGQNL